MDAESESSGRIRWASPAGVSALAAAAAVVVGLAGVMVQWNGSGSEPPGPVGGQSTSEMSPSTNHGTGAGRSEPEPSPDDPNGSVPANRVAAACIGCTPKEQAERQDHLDTLVARLAAPNDENCSDWTETFTDGPALARLGCSFPGGFDVDFALWASEADLSKFTALHRASPEAVAQEWRNLGNDGPLTGTTIEFVSDGVARFYWTYDEFLISGNAQYSSGEQDRLNDWWRSFGALLREPT